MTQTRALSVLPCYSAVKDHPSKMPNEPQLCIQKTNNCVPVFYTLVHINCSINIPFRCWSSRDGQPFLVRWGRALAQVSDSVYGISHVNRAFGPGDIVTAPPWRRNCNSARPRDLLLNAHDVSLPNFTTPLLARPFFA